MGEYIKYYDNFDKSKFKMEGEVNGKRWCYIHLSILKSALELVINKGYEVLGWEAIIYTSEGTLSPVELVTGTGPEIDKESRNKNALGFCYPYFISLIEKRSLDGEYRKEDVYIDLILK